MTLRYFVHKPITYTAVPSTSGYQTQDHTIRWTFDDGQVLDGFTVAKEWATPGNHTATATATNTITGGHGLASKVTLFIEYATVPGPMLTSKYGHRSLQLASGEILITGAGGYGGEFYDPITGRTQKNIRGMFHRNHGAVRLLDDRVIIMGGGGQGSSGVVLTTESYDANALFVQTPYNQFYYSPYDPGSYQSEAMWPSEPYNLFFNHPTTELMNNKSYFTSTLQADGKIVTIGGSRSSPGSNGYDLAAAQAGDTLNSVMTYDPTARGWVWIPHTGSTEYRYATGLWTLETATMTVPRSAHTATRLNNGKILVTGGAAPGYDPTDWNGGSWVMDPATPIPHTGGVPLGAWTEPHSWSAESIASAHAMADGQYGVGSSAPKTTFLNQIGTFPDTLLGTNWLDTLDGTPPTLWGVSGVWTHYSAEVYDPVAKTFSATTGPMSSPRMLHTATLLSNGKVLITGGSTVLQLWQQYHHYNYFPGPHPVDTPFEWGKDLVVLSSCEIYDPATGQFTSTGAMGEARVNHTATLLEDGRVLVVGGARTLSSLNRGIIDTRFGYSVQTCEIYDPVAGTWSYTGSLHTGRYLHTTTMLDNGSVVVTGGVWARGGYWYYGQTYATFPYFFLASVEVYDPGLGVFRKNPAQLYHTPQYAAFYAPGAVYHGEGINLIFDFPVDTTKKAFISWPGYPYTPGTGIGGSDPAYPLFVTGSGGEVDLSHGALGDTPPKTTLYTLAVTDTNDVVTTLTHTVEVQPYVGLYVEHDYLQTISPGSHPFLYCAASQGDANDPVNITVSGTLHWRTHQGVTGSVVLPQNNKPTIWPYASNLNYLVEGTHYASAYGYEIPPASDAIEYTLEVNYIDTVHTVNEIRSSTPLLFKGASSLGYNTLVRDYPTPITLTPHFPFGTGIIMPGNLVATNAVPIEVSPLVDTTYTLIVTQITAVDVSTVAVTVPTQATLTANTDNVLPGAAVVLTPRFPHGSGIITPGNLVAADNVPITVHPGVTTTYTLTVHSGIDTVTATSQTTVIIPASLTPVPATFNSPGDPVVLTAAFTQGTGVINPGAHAIVNGGTWTVYPSAPITYTLTVTSGSYTVNVTAFVNQTGMAIPISYGAQLSGELTVFTPMSLFHGSDYGLYYTFSGTAGDVISIQEINTSSLDTYLTLTNDMYSWIAFNDDGGYGTNSIIDLFVLPYTGTYFIEASAIGAGTGTFDIRLDLAAIPISYGGGTHAGTLGDGNFMSRYIFGEGGTSYGMMYNFSGVSGDTVTITMVSPDFQPAITLWDTSGSSIVTQVFSNFPDYTTAQILSFTLPNTGTYLIEASEGSRMPGSYDLTLVLG